MKLAKCLPNSLTSLRILLTFLYCPMLYNLHLNNDETIYFTLMVAGFIMICLTDLLDGKIARKMKAESRFGGIFDVVADFVFIVSSHIVLIVNRMIPIWFIAVILGKFIEFLITSYIIKKYSKIHSSVFIFDYLGRIAAVNFFVLPGLILLVYKGLNMLWINIFIYITVALAIISSSSRLFNCYNGLKIQILKGSSNKIDVN
jgi:CDP-diacylglycerol--glycerol-3-phosphate 3-phosphatidyltransferase